MWLARGMKGKMVISQFGVFEGEQDFQPWREHWRTAWGSYQLFSYTENFLSYHLGPIWWAERCLLLHGPSALSGHWEGASPQTQLGAADLPGMSWFPVGRSAGSCSSSRRVARWVSWSMFLPSFPSALLWLADTITLLPTRSSLQVCCLLKDLKCAPQASSALLPQRNNLLNISFAYLKKKQKKPKTTKRGHTYHFPAKPMEVL